MIFSCNNLFNRDTERLKYRSTTKNSKLLKNEFKKRRKKERKKERKNLRKNLRKKEFILVFYDSFYLFCY